MERLEENNVVIAKGIKRGLSSKHIITRAYWFEIELGLHNVV